MWKIGKKVGPMAYAIKVARSESYNTVPPITGSIFDWAQLYESPLHRHSGNLNSQAGPDALTIGD